MLIFVRKMIDHSDRSRTKHQTKGTNDMNIDCSMKVNKLFVNETKSGTYTRATLAYTDHRGHDLWISYNVPKTAAEAFVSSYPEGTSVHVVGLLFADNYKAKSGSWVNRIGIDVSNIEAL